MTGSPTDGLPWYAKLIVYAIYVPIAVAEKVSELAKKLKPKGKKG
jgi:hypothetical protein